MMNARAALALTLLTAGLACPARASAQAPAGLQDSLDAFIPAAMDAVDAVPGLTVVVVADDEIVYLEGFGLRDAEAGLPMGAGTVGYMASSTKSFIGLLAALMALEGEVDLDTPISTYVPDLELPDGLSADTITMRALLTHTSGLANTPVAIRTAYTGQHTREELFELLARSSNAVDRTFRYNNIGYVVTGLILEEIGGKPWKDMLAERIFGPLGLERTTGYVTRAEREGWDLAMPHFGGRDGIERIPYYKTDETMHAAGGLLTTADDLGRWLIANLSGGRLEGAQVLPAAAFEEAHRKQADADAEFYRFHRRGYGLGWYHSDYEGDLLLHHFGSFAGFRAHVSFMPEHGIGIAVLANEAGTGLLVPDLVATYAYDLLLGKPDLVTKYAEATTQMAAGSAERKMMIANHLTERAARPQELPYPLESYTGGFVSPDFGSLFVSLDEDGLQGVLGRTGSRIETYNPERNQLRIEIGGNGRVMQVAMADDSAESTRATSVSIAGSTFTRERPQVAAWRGVNWNVLTSSALPRARLEVDPALEYLGSQEFVLYGVADAEQHLFAEVEGDRVRRLLWVQFEGYLDEGRGSSSSYDYSEHPMMDVAGKPFHHTAGFARVPDEEPRPESDGARVRSFLAERGLSIGPDLGYQRLVWLLDSPARNELMIIYLEDLADHDVTAGDLEEGGPAEARRSELETVLLEKAVGSFRLSDF